MFLMDAVDRAILHHLQYDFPLTTRPFSTIAGRLNLSPREVIEHIARLKQKNIVRQISPIFDSSKIGYHSVLAAFKVPKQRLDSVARQLNALPTVTHNYARTNEYNLWFTVTIPDTEDLKKEVTRMASLAGISDWLFLPTIKKFKISFRLDMGDTGQARTAEVSEKKSLKDPSARIPVDKAFIRELQKDLRLAVRPYRSAARKLALTEGRIVAELQRYMKAGAIRRIAAVLRPVQAGYPANILTVWAPLPGKTDILGQTAARRNQVSHCYERPKCARWPYSVYTMIHGTSVAECRKIIRAIARDSGVKKYLELITVKEYKKIRIEYYPWP
jgi:DNA-binding Lrp family transcriptional regulator